MSRTTAFIIRNKTFKINCLSSSDRVLKPFSRKFEANGCDSSATPTGVILPRDTSQRSLEEEHLPDEEYEDDSDYRRGDYFLSSQFELVAVLYNRCFITSGLELDKKHIVNSSANGSLCSKQCVDQLISQMQELQRIQSNSQKQQEN
jgi:hypothetical protein